MKCRQNIQISQMSHFSAVLTAFYIRHDNLYIPTQNKPLESLKMSRCDLQQKKECLRGKHFAKFNADYMASYRQVKPSRTGKYGVIYVCK